MSRSFERRPVQALAIGLIALSVAVGASAGGVAAAPRATQAGPDTAPASRISTAASRAPVGIDTRNRAAVKRAYQRRLEPNLNVPIRWTGSNAGCHAGRASQTSKAATLESLNFVRALGHLAPVTFTRRLSAKAQQAALIMSANGALSHDPPRSWKCWTRAGSNAAGHSNLAYGFPTLTAGATIVQYMTDPGETNYFAGHRRWLMYPYTAHMGNGATTQTNAIWVLSDTVLSRPDPAWVGWPTAGWFPAPLEPAGRWSLSASDDSVSFANARVRVTNAAGQRLRTHVQPVAVGYGPGHRAQAGFTRPVARATCMAVHACRADDVCPYSVDAARRTGSILITLVGMGVGGGGRHARMVRDGAAGFHPRAPAA